MIDDDKPVDPDDLPKWWDHATLFPTLPAPQIENRAIRKHQRQLLLRDLGRRHCPTPNPRRRCHARPWPASGPLVWRTPT